MTAETILSRLNAEICRDNDSCMFVTVFCALLNVGTGQVEYSNAGHNLPYVLSDGAVTALTNTGGMALGVSESASFHAGCIVLKPGDRLVLYTDGVTEAMDRNDELFSEDRLEQTLHGVQGQHSKKIIEKVTQDVQRFADGAPQSDDITLLVLGYIGPDQADERYLTISLKNDLAELPSLSEAATEFSERQGLPIELVNRVNLVLEEIVTNVISYGYDDSLEHEIAVRLSWNKPWIEIEIEDDGRPFNPLEAPPPEMEKPLVERQIGGLGIHLVRNMMDDLEYRRENGKNCLRLKSNIGET